MALTYLPAAQANAAIEAIYPSNGIVQAISATSDGAKTLTCSSVSDSQRIVPGMAVTGTGITSGVVSSVNESTGVITCTGTFSGTAAGNYTFTLSLYGSLHTTSPGTTGANETNATGYARQFVTLGAPASGVKSSTNAQTWTFTAAPSGALGYFGLWSAVSSGTYVGGGALTSSLSPPAGSLVTAAIAALTAQVQG